MKHVIQITVEEAKDLARAHYNVAGVSVEITDLSKPVDYCLTTNKDVARSSKIALIKFMRQVTDDFNLGRIEKNDTGFASLASAKAYVEKYFQI